MLRSLSFFIVLCLFLAALEIVLISRAPWWNLPYESIGIWCGALLMITLPLAVWMGSGRRWALYLTGFFGLTWCLLTIAVAVFSKNFWLGVFSLVLSVLWFAIWYWLTY